MTKIIGLTGGIGSGKSTLAKHLLSIGIPVYIADDEAKKIMHNTHVVQEIVSHFGREILNKNTDTIDTKKLAAKVFNQKEQLEKLNAIIHPKVKDHFEAWLQLHQQSPVVVKEAAILFESGSYKDCDFIITVVAPEELRIARVIDRDQTNSQNIRKRMEHQWSDDQKIEKSDFVIQNINLEDAKKTIETAVESIIKSIK